MIKTQLLPQGLPVDTATSEDPSSEIEQTLRHVWPDSAPSVTGCTEVSGGRGVFSRVYAIDLDWRQKREGEHPSRLILKLPALGPNRTAAIRSGAYEREERAYRDVLSNTPIFTPEFFGSYKHHDGAIAFVLEDLGHGRAVDQVLGLGVSDASIVANDLGRWHHTSRQASQTTLAASLQIRRSIPGGLNDDGLQRGLETLRTTWADVLSTTQITQFERLVQRREPLISQFDAGPESLCHGDVRADNLAFDVDARPLVFFDWQQIAIQMGEADLAWLTSTSLEPTIRRETERDLVSIYAQSAGTSTDQSWDRYRTALIVPGLAVLFLAQRELVNDRARTFVAASLIRIATALSDHQVA